MSHYYIVKAERRSTVAICEYVPESGGYSRRNLTGYRSNAKRMVRSSAYWYAFKMAQSGQFPDEVWRIVVVRVKERSHCRTCKRPL